MLAKLLPPLTGDYWQLLQSGCWGHGRVPVLGISHRRLCRAGTWALGQGHSEAQEEYLRCWGRWAAALCVQWALHESSAAGGTHCKRRLCLGRMVAGEGELASVLRFQPCPVSNCPKDPLFLPSWSFFFLKPSPELKPGVGCSTPRPCPPAAPGAGALNISHSPKSQDCGLVV